MGKILILILSLLASVPADTGGPVKCLRCQDRKGGPGASIIQLPLDEATETAWKFFRMTTTQLGAATANETWWGQIELHDVSGLFTPLNLTGDTGGVITVTAGNVYTVYSAWKAFDNSTATMWGCLITFSTGLHWIQIECPSAKTPIKLAAVSDSFGGGYTPRGFKLEGSNTGAFSGEQTLLASISTTAWSNAERREFTIP